MKNLQFAVLFILTSLYITAQNPNRKFESFINYSTYVEVKTNDGVYRFQPYGNEIIERIAPPRVNPNPLTALSAKDLAEKRMPSSLRPVFN